ncbi:MAG TPA: tetratricopeptide repeat protein [Terriglobia bacterium]|nr:tetratricopeptide repeat protein [Terriglobia bacterium]
MMRYTGRSETVVLTGVVAVLALALPVRAGDRPCATCHPRETAGYASTQMAHSLGAVTRQPDGGFVHAASQTHFSVVEKDSAMVQRLEREGVAGDYVPAYAIGSGTHAVGYLIDLKDHLFQSPICFYTGRGWDIAPGYEKNEAPDFLRPVTAECLACHAGRARPAPHSLNRFEATPFEAEAITCERCHGPVEAHLRNPVPGSIINPASLPPRARDSVCEQCHLSGEARIPNPGKQISDFRPGQALEDVFSVYIFEGSRDPARPGALKVISQAQQLALSTCARRSNGKLWCGTCHDPHNQPADPKAYFRARCLSCHGAALLGSHPQPNQDCVGCHMPHRVVSDGGHTVFTDHRIARRPPAESGAPAETEPQALVAWHDPAPALAERNLALAEVEVGERTKSFAMIAQGSRTLMQAWADFPSDPAVLTSIGQVLLGLGDGNEALAVFERAIQADPDDPRNYIHAALASKTAHDPEKAIQYLEKALRLDPVMEQPYLELAAIYAAHGEPAMAHLTYERYLKVFPKSIEAQRGVRSSATY